MFKHLLPALIALAGFAFCPMAMVAESGNTKTTDTVVIEVDYDADFEALIKACEFSSRESSINAKNFPSTDKGKIKREFKVFRFDQKLLSNEAAIEIKKRGFRPATTFELVAFLANRPKEHCHQIAAVGQEWQGLIAAVGITGNNRQLAFAPAGNDWSAGYRFLGIR